MNLKKQKTRVGIKIFVDKKHIKTIPIKYENVFTFNHIVDKTRKRLTIKERENLEKSFKSQEFEHKVQLFEESLKENEPYVYELVGGSKPKLARKVIDFYGKTDYELLYENSVRLRTSRKIYNLFVGNEMQEQ